MRVQFLLRVYELIIACLVMEQNQVKVNVGDLFPHDSVSCNWKCIFSRRLLYRQRKHPLSQSNWKDLTQFMTSQISSKVVPQLEDTVQIKKIQS